MTAGASQELRAPGTTTCAPRASASAASELDRVAGERPRLGGGAGGAQRAPAAVGGTPESTPFKTAPPIAPDRSPMEVKNLLGFAGVIEAASWQPAPRPMEEPQLPLLLI